MEAGVSSFNRDTWTGIAGALVLIAAMTGVFFYERGQFHEYEVQWTPNEAISQQDSGTLEAGASEAYTLEVDDPALAQVRAVLTWTDDTPPADTFRLEITGPSTGLSEAAEADSGPLEAVVPVTEQPEATAVGRNAQDAEEQASATTGGEQGQGTWTITVTLVSAPGQALPGGAEVQPDGANAYELTIAYDVWEPTVQERT